MHTTDGSEVGEASSIDAALAPPHCLLYIHQWRCVQVSYRGTEKSPIFLDHRYDTCFSFLSRPAKPHTYVRILRFKSYCNANHSFSLRPTSAPFALRLHLCGRRLFRGSVWKPHLPADHKCGYFSGVHRRIQRKYWPRVRAEHKRSLCPLPGARGLTFLAKRRNMDGSSQVQGKISPAIPRQLWQCRGW